MHRHGRAEEGKNEGSGERERERERERREGGREGGRGEICWLLMTARSPINLSGYLFTQERHRKT